jgi:hypothetical protein
MAAELLAKRGVIEIWPETNQYQAEVAKTMRWHNSKFEVYTK